MMRSISLVLAVLTVGAAAWIVSAATPRSPRVEAMGGAPPDSTPIRVELRVLEVKGDALRESGVRVGTIGSDPTSGEAADPATLLSRTDGRGGVSVLVDQAFTIPTETEIRYRAGRAVPTSSTTLTAGGVAIEGFQGYESGGVFLGLRASRPDEGKVIVEIEYRIAEHLGDGVDGIPPARVEREGRFLAPVPIGTTSFQGGMIRIGVESNYLLFYVKASLAE
jgi:hypothetical protein